ncbi:hypothetical protein PSTT_11682 [Puccinia striiformis]|uniref:Uncharacterized protein n=1 Tax=Puccinia striiformis TaxID=27350 RepID=A0A2S4UZB2_9BASI|nr:hypothetical protein PSTT_11682 [Puccinia striiformis]
MLFKDARTLYVVEWRRERKIQEFQSVISNQNTGTGTLCLDRKVVKLDLFPEITNQEIVIEREKILENSDNNDLQTHLLTPRAPTEA